MEERLFGSIELAARIERAETNLLRGCVEASARLGSARAISVPVSGGLATWADPQSPINKVAGLGFGGALDERALASVEAAFDERETPVQVELSCLGDPAVATQLAKRGYVLTGFEHVLGRPLLAVPPFQPPADISISVCSPSEMGLWLDVVVTGFAAPDERGVPAQESFPREALERTLRGMTAEGGFRHCLARRQGQTAGGGSLRIDADGEIAQLCGAATLPQHRRRGIQAALLAERLAMAATEGCRLVVVTTQPGSTSQQNVERQGFQLLYARAVLVRERA